MHDGTDLSELATNLGHRLVNLIWIRHVAYKVVNFISARVNVSQIGDKLTSVSDFPVFVGEFGDACLWTSSSPLTHHFSTGIRPVFITVGQPGFHLRVAGVRAPKEDNRNISLLCQRQSALTDDATGTTRHHNARVCRKRLPYCAVRTRYWHRKNAYRIPIPFDIPYLDFLIHSLVSQLGSESTSQ